MKSELLALQNDVMQQMDEMTSRINEALNQIQDIAHRSSQPRVVPLSDDRFRGAVGTALLARLQKQLRLRVEEQQLLNPAVLRSQVMARDLDDVTSIVSGMEM